jgi:hypothetical protein
MADSLKKQFPLTYLFMKKYGEQVAEEMRTRLKGHNKYASGKLFNSIKSNVVEENGELILTFFKKPVPKYAEYVDKGVNGYDRRRGSPFSYKRKDGNHKPKKKSEFIESLMKWCRIKGIDKGAAFAIRRNIWKFGIAPTQFFTIPTKRRQAQFDKQMEKLMAQDIEKQIEKEFK